MALLLMAALAVTSVLSGCQAVENVQGMLTRGEPAASSTATPADGAPSAGALTPAAPPGGVEVALAAITWPGGPAVARVNGVDIQTQAWRDEVTRQLRLVTSQYQVDWNDQANLDHLPEIQDSVIDRLVDLELLRQLAEREGATATDSEVQATAQKAQEQITGSGRYESMDAYLEDNALSQARFDELVRQQATIDKMITAHGGPSEMEQIRARHILVADEATAKEVLDKLAANESFEDLAKTYSTDTGSKDQGGDLGWFPRGAMVTEFEDAAFALQPGQTSEAVQTVYGYHIIRVEERAVHPLEEPLLSQMQERNFTTWLDTERQAATIERIYVAVPAATPQPR